MDPLPLVRTVAGHEPVRGIVLALLCICVLAAFALPAARRWPAAWAVGALGLLVGFLAGGTDGFAWSYLIPLAAICVVLALRRFRLAPLLLLAVLGGDLAWQATHQDQRLRWLSASQVTPAPSGSAAFLLARQHSDGPFRVATSAPEPVLVHQLGAHRSASARALLLDQEALRLGLEDVAGYNPVHLKRYNRLMLASNGGRPVDRHFEFALRPATPQLRSLAVRYYVSPPGDAPAGLPVVYRDKLSVVTQDDGALPFARIVRPGRAPLAARVVSREPDRIVIAPPGPGRLVVADLVYPGWKVTVDGKPARSLAEGDLRAVEVPAGARTVTWSFTPPGVRSGCADLARGIAGARRSRGRALAARTPDLTYQELDLRLVPLAGVFRSCRNLPMLPPWPHHSPPSSTTTPSIRTPPPRCSRGSRSGCATPQWARSWRSSSAWRSSSSATRRSRCRPVPRRWPGSSSPCSHAASAAPW